MLAGPLNVSPLPEPPVSDSKLIKLSPVNGVGAGNVEPGNVTHRREGERAGDGARRGRRVIGRVRRVVRGAVGNGRVGDVPRVRGVHRPGGARLAERAARGVTVTDVALLDHL